MCSPSTKRTLHHLFQHSSFISLNGFTGTTPLPPQLQRKPSVRQYPETPNPFSAIPSKGLKHGKTLWMPYVFKGTTFIYPTRHNEQEYRNFLICDLRHANLLHTPQPRPQILLHPNAQAKTHLFGRNKLHLPQVSVFTCHHFLGSDKQKH